MSHADTHVLMLAASGSLHTRRWACDLATAGYAITLLTADPSEPPAFAQAYAKAGVAVERLPYTSKSGFVRSAGYVYSRVMDFEAGGRPVAFLHAFYTSEYGLLAVLSGAAPVLLSVMGTDVFSYADNSWLHRRGIAWILKRADAVAATSKVMVQRVAELTDGFVQAYHTPFGVDTRIFSPQANEDSASNPESLRIISVRHLHHKYGLDVLIEALRLLSEQHPEANFELHIGGDGPERENLQQQIHNSFPDGQIRLLGRIPPDELPELLPAYDVFVAPSREESFGVAILEASACGLPVIGSETGGIPEVIIHEKTGLLFPSEDAQALCQALYSLYKHPEKRRDMGRAGVDFVRRSYSRTIALNGMKAVYEHIMADKAF
jgi:glycosyltransferase involved in cell wall biosynthesis